MTKTKETANFEKCFRKLSTGNYAGWYRGYYIFIYKRPHGTWCCRIRNSKEWLWQEGYHGTSLRTVAIAKQWAKFRVMPSCRTEFHKTY